MRRSNWKEKSDIILCTKRYQRSHANLKDLHTVHTHPLHTEFPRDRTERSRPTHNSTDFRLILHIPGALSLTQIPLSNSLDIIFAYIGLTLIAVPPYRNLTSSIAVDVTPIAIPIRVARQAFKIDIVVTAGNVDERAVDIIWLPEYAQVSSEIETASSTVKSSSSTDSRVTRVPHLSEKYLAVAIQA